MLFSRVMIPYDGVGMVAWREDVLKILFFEWQEDLPAIISRKTDLGLASQSGRRGRGTASCGVGNLRP